MGNHFKRRTLKKKSFFDCVDFERIKCDISESKLYFQIMGQEDVKVRRCCNKLSSSKATFISSLRRETEAIIARCYIPLLY